MTPDLEKAHESYLQPQAVTVKLAPHESRKTKLTPSTERPASTNVMMNQQP